MSALPPDVAHLLDGLRAVYGARTDELLARFARSVSFGDVVVDRWERARRLGWGEGASVYDSALVIGDVRVGERTWVGPHTVLDGSGGLEIGATCNISAGTQIYTHDSVRWTVSGGAAQYERAPVTIGSHTYIGPMSIVTKGVTIGRHCIVGANSVVNKDVPDFAIAVGSTCRIVGRVVLGDDGSVELRYDAPPHA